MYPVQHLNDLLKLFFGSDSFTVHFHIDSFMLIELLERKKLPCGSYVGVRFLNRNVSDRKAHRKVVG